MTDVVRGLHLLIVEDESLLAMVLGDHLVLRGATVIGPAPSVDEALSLVHGAAAIDAAYLDMTLRGASSAPVADALLERGVPIVVVTATADRVPDRLRHVTILEKPVSLERIATALAEAAGRR